MKQRFGELAPILVENGFVPVAVGAGRDDKTEPSRGFTWGADSYGPEQAINGRLEKYADSFTSLRLDDVVYIDLDIDDPDARDEVRRLQGEILGRTDFIRLSPGGREAALYQVEDGLTASGWTAKFAIGDFDGQQVEVFAGPIKVMGAWTLHKSGAPYVWPQKSPLTHHRFELPFATLETINRFITAAQAALAARGVPEKGQAVKLLNDDRGADEVDPAARRMDDWDWITRAMTFLHPDNYDHHERINIMYALQGAVGEDRKEQGEKVWMAWRSQERGFSWKDEKKARENWRSSTSRKLGWQRLRRLAMENGFKDNRRGLLLEKVPAPSDAPEVVDPSEGERRLQVAIRRWAKAIQRAKIAIKAMDKKTDAELAAGIIDTPEQAKRRKRIAEIEEALGKHRDLIAITMGAGKTRAALAAGLEMAAHGLVVWYLVPTHKLMHELAEVVRGMGGAEHLSVYQGRLSRGDEGVVDRAASLCERPAAMQAYVASGRTSPGPDMCRQFHKDKLGNVTGTTDCPMFGRCRYQAQAGQPGRLILFAQEYIHLTLGADFLPVADAWIVDELQPATLLTSGSTVNADHLKLWPEVYDALVEAVEADGSFRRQVVHAARLLKDRGVTREKLEEIRSIQALKYEARQPKITPDMSDHEIIKAAADTNTEERAFLLLKVIADEWSSRNRRAELYGAHPTIKRDAECELPGNWWRVMYRRAVVRARADLPILFLDGTPSRTLLELAFGKLRTTKIDVRLNARVVHAWGASFSRTSLEGSAEKVTFVADLAKEAIRIGAKGTATRGLLLCDKRLVKPIEKAIGEWPALSDDGDIIGDAIEVRGLPVRGLDRWKNHDVAMVVGRIFPTASDLEAVAKAYLYNRDEDVLEVGKYNRTPRAFLAPGCKADEPLPGRLAYVHQDPIVEEFRRLAQEAEVIQGIHRLRLVHRTDPAAVLILGDQPLPGVAVNELIHIDELGQLWLGRTRTGAAYNYRARPSGWRVLEAMRREGGRLLLSAKWLAVRFPLLWATEGAAKNDLQAVSLSGVLKFKVTLEGRRGKPAVLVLERDLEAAVAWLETVTGTRVKRVDWLGW